MHRMFKIEWLLRVVIIIACMAHWYIWEESFYTMHDVIFEGSLEKSYISWRTIIPSLMALCIFMFPYEYVFSLIAHLIQIVSEWIGSFWETIVPSVSGKGLHERTIYVFLGALAYTGGYIYADEGFSYFLSSREQFVPFTLIAILCMCLLNNAIRNEIARYILCVAFCVFHAELVYSVNDYRFIEAIIIYLFLLITWHVYDSFLEAKIDGLKIVCSIEFSLILFVMAVIRTGHYRKLIKILTIDDTPVLNLSGINMSCSLNGSFLYKEMLWSKYDGHPFILMNRFMGGGYVALDIILMLIAMTAIIMQTIIVLRRSNTVMRAAVFVGVFIWYLLVYLYAAGSDVVGLPSGNLYLSFYDFYVFGLAVMFRSIYIGKSHCRKRDRVISPIKLVRR